MRSHRKRRKLICRKRRELIGQKMKEPIRREIRELIRRETNHVTITELMTEIVKEGMMMTDTEIAEVKNRGNKMDILQSPLNTDQKRI